MSLVWQVVTQCSEMRFRMTWPPSSHFLPYPSYPSLMPSLLSHLLFIFLLFPPLLPTFLSLSSLVSFLPLLSSLYPLPPSVPFLSLSPPSLRPFPLSIPSLARSQFPLPEVVVIHRDPSGHEDLRHLKNYILEVRTRMLLPDTVTQSQRDEVVPVTTPPNTRSICVSDNMTFSHIMYRS